MPEIDIPVGVSEKMVSIGMVPSASPKEQTVGYFGLILFDYLLSVGYYTHKQTRHDTRTIQFRYQNIAFKRGNVILSRTVSLEELLQATGATLRLSNNKM